MSWRNVKIGLTRVRAFEASHRYWLPELTADQNRRFFGACASPYGHGHNYRCQATIHGEVDGATGMVVNIKDLDAELAALLGELDHRFLNEEWPALAGRQPTTEVLALVLRERLQARLADWPVRLALLRVYEREELWADAHTPPHGDLSLVTLTRVYSFSAAHRLHESALSDEQNRAIFGKCNNPLGHGHDYRLEVTVGGDVDPRTGMVVDLAELDALVRLHLLDRWDHRHLNHEVPELAGVNPTSENVVRVAWEVLAPHLGARLVKLTLWETPKSAFEYSGRG